MSSSLEASRRPSYHSLVRRCISTLAARTSCVCWEGEGGGERRGEEEGRGGGKRGRGGGERGRGGQEEGRGRGERKRGEGGRGRGERGGGERGGGERGGGERPGQVCEFQQEYNMSNQYVLYKCKYVSTCFVNLRISSGLT